MARRLLKIRNGLTLVASAAILASIGCEKKEEARVAGAVPPILFPPSWQSFEDGHSAIYRHTGNGCFFAILEESKPYWYAVKGEPRLSLPAGELDSLNDVSPGSILIDSAAGTYQAKSPEEFLQVLSPTIGGSGHGGYAGSEFDAIGLPGFERRKDQSAVRVKDGEWRTNGFKAFITLASSPNKKYLAVAVSDEPAKFGTMFVQFNTVDYTGNEYIQLLDPFTCVPLGPAIKLIDKVGVMTGTRITWTMDSEYVIIDGDRKCVWIVPVTKLLEPRE